jgi:hypothetical protein
MPTRDSNPDLADFKIAHSTKPQVTDTCECLRTFDVFRAIPLVDSRLGQRTLVDSESQYRVPCGLCADWPCVETRGTRQGNSRQPKRASVINGMCPELAVPRYGFVGNAVPSLGRSLPSGEAGVTEDAISIGGVDLADPGTYESGMPYEAFASCADEPRLHGTRTRMDLAS